MIEFDFELALGEFRLHAQGRQESPRMGLFGPSGAGKTTLLHCFAGLIRPNRGYLKFNDEYLFNADARVHVPAYRRRIGYVFQDGRLFPHLTVRRNIEYGRSGGCQAPALDELSELLGLEGILDRYTKTLSGGECQRVALARALAAGPRLLLLDEPLASVDEESRLTILCHLKRIHERWKLPFVFVSHSFTDVMFLTEKTWWIRQGRLHQSMNPRDLLGRKAMPDQKVLNILESRIMARPQRGGFVVASCYGQTIKLPSDGLCVGDEVAVALPARDLMISLTRPERISARNIMTATIERLDSTAEALWVHADVGGRQLVVEITPDAGDELQLRVGMQVCVIFKSHSATVAKMRNDQEYAA